jgi:hypothetical protein
MYDVAFYVKAVNPFTPVDLVAIYASNITQAGKACILSKAFTKDTKIYMQDYSYDLWSMKDDFTFKYQKDTGDVEVTVRIDSLD